MQKISIKREQSQAGLSFAERENRRSAAGGKVKFRPQVKNKLLLLLALLMTAATGAWAQGAVDGTIVWSVGNEASATVSASIKDAISSTGVTTGSGLTVVTATYFDTNMVRYQPSTSNAGNVSGVMIEYRIEAVDGYKFKPTGVDYAAVKDGNDNISYSWSYTIDGVESAITDVSKDDVLRSNGNNSATAQLMHSESITADGCSVFTLRFYISNCGNTKKICIGNITISGSVSAAASGYTVSLNDGTENPTTWTASTDGTNFGALPIGGLKGDGSETVTLKYNGRLKVKSVTATSEAVPAAPAGNIVDLSGLTADYEAQDGDILSGVLGGNYKITIADGATVTLDGANIGSGDYCIKCAGSATIILKDGSTNTLTSTSEEYPALWAGDANTTLTIQGNTGVLNVTSGDYCAGIGGGYSNTNSTCGNIRIEGGVITAQGGISGSGIGADCGKATCGDIIITGGTITAKGGKWAAGIGTGYGDGDNAVCGNITIANTVTKVTATAGSESPYSIGKGGGGTVSCGTITIGGTGYGNDGISTSPYTYQP